MITLNVSNESVTSSKRILSRIIKVPIFEPNEGKFIHLEHPLFGDPFFLSHARKRNCFVSLPHNAPPLQNTNKQEQQKESLSLVS